MPPQTLISVLPARPLKRFQLSSQISDAGATCDERPSSDDEAASHVTVGLARRFVITDAACMQYTSHDTLAVFVLFLSFSDIRIRTSKLCFGGW